MTYGRRNHWADRRTGTDLGTNRPIPGCSALKGSDSVSVAAITMTPIARQTFQDVSVPSRPLRHEAVARRVFARLVLNDHDT